MCSSEHKKNLFDILQRYVLGIYSELLKQFQTRKTYTGQAKEKKKIQTFPSSFGRTLITFLHPFLSLQVCDQFYSFLIIEIKLVSKFARRRFYLLNHAPDCFPINPLKLFFIVLVKINKNIILFIILFAID